MNLAATREALDRFVAELPTGLAADRLRRNADATRGLIDQALAEPGSDSPWADHNLAVVVADGLAEAATEEAALALFLGVRRRLADALERDADDLAHALALALGATRALDDARCAADIDAVASAVGRPQAGPRLIGAAVELLVAASGASDRDVADAATRAAEAVRVAADRLGSRLPDHPGAALDRVRLALLTARAAEGDARAAALGVVRGLLRDHETRFGETQAAREILGGVLAIEARSQTPPADLKRDALALLEADLRSHALSPKRTTRLIRTIERSGQLDAATAQHLDELLSPAVGADDPRWFETRALLYEATGDRSALLTLWQHTLEADPKSKHAARGVLERLLQNLRQGLAPPFESPTLDRALTALSPAHPARWSADDIDRLLTLVTDTFGSTRAYTFVADKLLNCRELRGRDFIWQRALALAGELGEDSDAVVDVARAAIKHRGLPEARLALARALIARSEHVDEADAVLRPLLDKKGAHSAEAHALRGRLKGDPALRRARYDTLLAYEHRLGVGTGKVFPLQIVYTTRSYVLAELTDHPAPDGYEHKHLRTMIRAEDLPSGVTPVDLDKGDIVHAPLRGQDADTSHDKDGLRVYWVADPAQVRLDLDADAIAARWSSEEAAFGVDSGQPVLIKVAWDKKKRRLAVRVLSPDGKREFRTRPALNPERLPAGIDPERVGVKGRRFMGLVARTDDGSRPGQRAYAVVSDLVAATDAAPTADAPGAAEPDGGGAKRSRRGKRRAEKSAPSADAPSADAAPATGEASPGAGDAPATAADAPTEGASSETTRPSPPPDAPTGDAPVSEAAAAGPSGDGAADRERTGDGAAAPPTADGSAP